VAETVDMSFTREEVEQALQKDLWKRQRAFHEEINPEDMADTAAIYARAAEDGATAGNLASRASEIATGAGEHDGTPLADGAARFEQTARDLLHNDDPRRGLDHIPYLLVGAMRSAITADEEVYKAVYGPGALEDSYIRHARLSALEGARYLEGVDDPGYIGVVNVLREIRDRHFAAVRSAAYAATDAMDSAIDAYRTKLLNYARELTAEGYDVSEGPFTAFTTEQTAAWATERLSELLEEEPPNAVKVNDLLAGVDGIIRGVYDEGAAPGRKMTEAERTYLKTFYDGLDEKELATLGRLGRIPGDDLADIVGHSVDAAFGLAAQWTAANGINLLLNPDAGGLDPGRDGENVPAGVRHYVYGYPDYADSPLPYAEVPDWSAFGDLMGSSTLATGNQFSQDLATAAADYERLAGDYGADSDEGPVNTGTKKLLEVAGRNPEAAAARMSDHNFSSLLLGQDFTQGPDAPRDADGSERREPLVDSFVAAATLPPAGIDPRSDAAKPYADAAYRYLELARYPEAFDQVDPAWARHLRETWREVDPERFGVFGRPRFVEI
jgi:hypothetical protein